MARARSVHLIDCYLFFLCLSEPMFRPPLTLLNHGRDWRGSSTCSLSPSSRPFASSRAALVWFSLVWSSLVSGKLSLLWLNLHRVGLKRKSLERERAKRATIMTDYRPALKASYFREWTRAGLFIVCYGRCCCCCESECKADWSVLVGACFIRRKTLLRRLNQPPSGTLLLSF